MMIRDNSFNYGRSEREQWAMGLELDLSDLKVSVFLIMMIPMECYRFICKTLNSRTILLDQIKFLIHY